MLVQSKNKLLEPTIVQRTLCGSLVWGFIGQNVPKNQPLLPTPRSSPCPIKHLPASHMHAQPVSKGTHSLQDAGTGLILGGWEGCSTRRLRPLTLPGSPWLGGLYAPFAVLNHKTQHLWPDTALPLLRSKSVAYRRCSFLRVLVS